MEDDPTLGTKTSEVLNNVSKAPRIGPIAVWKMTNGVLVPTPGYENTKVFTDTSERPHLRIIETPPQPSWEERVAGLWNNAQESFESYRLYFGIPDTIHDLSVDRFTARRLTASDYTAMVSLRSEDNIELHPELIESAQQYLQGRNTSIKHETNDTVTMYFNVKDGSQETFDDVAHFAYSFGWMSGLLPLALTYRYRNFSRE